MDGECVIFYAIASSACNMCGWAAVWHVYGWDRRRLISKWYYYSSTSRRLASSYRRIHFPIRLSIIDSIDQYYIWFKRLPFRTLNDAGWSCRGTNMIMHVCDSTRLIAFAIDIAVLSHIIAHSIEWRQTSAPTLAAIFFPDRIAQNVEVFRIFMYICCCNRCAIFLFIVVHTPQLHFSPSAKH